MADDDPFHVVQLGEWPLVLFKLVRAPKSNDEIDNFQTQFQAVLHMAIHGSSAVKPGKVFVLLNMDGILAATLPQMVRAGSFIREVQPYVASAIEATALVISSERTRDIMSFVFKLQPLTSRHALFESDASAEAWLREQVPVPPQEQASVPPQEQVPVLPQERAP